MKKRIFVRNLTFILKTDFCKKSHFYFKKASYEKN